VTGHPRDLRAYALGDLSDVEAAAVERHLAACRACRRDVRRWRNELEWTVAALPSVTPSGAARARALDAARAVLSQATPQQDVAAQALDASTSARRATRDTTMAPPRPARPWNRRPLAWAGALVVTIAALAGTGGLAWQRHAAWRAVESERALVAAWLTRDDVVTRALPAAPGSRSPGSVMVADDGVVLVVMRGAAPTGRIYQAWGHEDATAVSLGTLPGTVLHTDASGFGAVSISVEPAGGSPLPTEPLGRVPLGS
jgi:hypothetical protein